MDETIQSHLEGTKDMFPEDHRYLTFLKKVFRHEFRKNGFGRISTPLIESEALLRKAYPKNGNAYGLYNFEAKNGENIALLPTHTPGIIRSYLEYDMQEMPQPVYYYYMERSFRQSRTRKECYVFGGEVIGESDPIIDAQNIYLTLTALAKIGITDVSLSINSYGNSKEMEKFTLELENYLENKSAVMSQSLQDEYKNNPMALFFSSDEDDAILASKAPHITKFLKKDSKKHYENFKMYLHDLGIEYQEASNFFFLEDFYTGIIWKIEDSSGNLLASGGRYDDFAQRLGSAKPYPAAGFSIDAQRILAKLKEESISIKNKDQIDLYFVQLGDEAKRVVFPLSLEARARGINTQASLGTPSIKEQMLKARRIGSKYVVMVGLMEARNGIFQLRNVEDGTQEEVKKEELIENIIKKIGSHNLNFYEPSRDLLQK